MPGSGAGSMYEEAKTPQGVHYRYLHRHPLSERKTIERLDKCHQHLLKWGNAHYPGALRSTCYTFDGDGSITFTGDDPMMPALVGGLRALATVGRAAKPDSRGMSGITFPSMQDFEKTIAATHKQGLGRFL